ncbi:MAG: DUF2029 domain-containing protein [Acidobacteria bacterium]|nr:DUF2029 domain-containing protein [Acidobacteriota bacterium]
MDLRKIQASLLMTIVVIFCVPLAFGSRKAEQSKVRIDDFIEYWAGGKLTIEGANPYDPEEMLRVERLVDSSMPLTIMMWNPPWTMSLVMPFSLLDYRTASILWLLMHMFIVMASGGWLWHYYGGKTETACLVALGALLFPPGLIALGNGQITPLMLGGVCAFLFMVGRGRYVPAGLAASVTFIKPHLSYLIWGAILLWSIHRKQWRVIIGAIFGAAGLMAAPLLLNPHICQQYLAAMVNYPPDYYLSPTIGTLARLVLGWEKWWPQFAPNLIGIAWLVWYWLPRRHDWNWKDHLPVVLSISLLTSAFGWLFDLVLFLIPFVQTSVSPGRRKRPGLAAIAWGAMLSACALTLILWPTSVLIGLPRNIRSAETALSSALSRPNQFWQIVVAPLFLLGFFVAWRRNADIGPIASASIGSMPSKTNNGTKSAS